MSEHIHNNSSDGYIFTIGELSTMKGFSTVIKRAIELEYPYCNVSVAPHTKNNGLTLLGLTITDMKYNLAPTFYLERNTSRTSIYCFADTKIPDGAQLYGTPPGIKTYTRIVFLSHIYIFFC